MGVVIRRVVVVGDAEVRQYIADTWIGVLASSAADHHLGDHPAEQVGRRGVEHVPGQPLLAIFGLRQRIQREEILEGGDLVICLRSGCANNINQQ